MPIPLNLQVHRPATANEALAVLDEYGDDAAVYAGGTELLVLLKLGLARQQHLVDVKGVAGMDDVEVLGDGTLRLGAAVTHLSIRTHPLVGAGWPCLARALAAVGNIRVQSTGTIGGNLCFADPQSDPATLLVASEATVRCADAHGAYRTVPVDEFLVDAYSTSLRDGAELLATVEVPAVGAGTVLAHRKISFGERPDATCAVRLSAHDGRVSGLRVVAGSVTGSPLVCSVPEQLVGVAVAELRPDSAALAEVSASCAAEVRANAQSDKRTPFMAAIVTRLIRSTIAEAAVGIDM